MATVKIADLKNNLSRHLAHVRQGGELTVLDRDTPDRPDRAVRAAAAERGARRWANRRARRPANRRHVSRNCGGWASSALVIRRVWPQWLRMHEPIKLPKGTPSAVDLLIQMRRESTR